MPTRAIMSAVRSSIESTLSVPVGARFNFDARVLPTRGCRSWVFRYLHGANRYWTLRQKPEPVYSTMLKRGCVQLGS